MFHAVYSRITNIFFDQEVYVSSNGYSSKNFKSKARKFKNILLVTGRKSYEESGAKKLITDSFKNSEISTFNEFEVNPDISQLKIGYEDAIRLKPDAIVAIGGGSVIDAAKIIHTMYSYGLDDKQIFNFNYRELRTQKDIIPLIAIPTTAGTGSESTHFAVLYNNKKKFSIALPQMLPSIVFLDAGLCLSNSSYQNACSGFDALAQAIESYWSKNSNIISRFYAKKSIRLVLKNFEQIMKKEANNKKYFFIKMLRASNYAGRAINLTKTTGPHAISYGITQHLGLPHGHAVALTLGAFFILHNRIFHEHETNLKRFKEIDEFISTQTKKKSSEYLYDLMYKFNMEHDINKLGLSIEKIDMLIENINLQRMSNHPIKLDNFELRKVFELIPKTNASIS